MLSSEWASFNINWSKFFFICICHYQVIKSLTEFVCALDDFARHTSSWITSLTLTIKWGHFCACLQIKKVRVQVKYCSFGAKQHQLTLYAHATLAIKWHRTTLTSRFNHLQTCHRSSMSFDCKCCMRIYREWVLFNSKWAIFKLKCISCICSCHLNVIKSLTSRFYLLHTCHRLNIALLELNNTNSRYMRMQHLQSNDIEQRWHVCKR
jgi:hypothetical protein